MIEGKRVLGVIPARGGSKGLPRKNVLPLRGKPLIAWTIEAALASGRLDRLVLTSDDEEIMQVARDYGCEVPFRRPPELAADDTPGIAPVLHAVEQLSGFDYVVVLQPTSPLRAAHDIDGAVDECVRRGAPSCVSTVRVTKPPQWMYTMDAAGRLTPVLPGSEQVTQRDQAEVFALNGAVYVAEIEFLRKSGKLVTAGTVGFVMPPERSVDVDTELDLLWCEFLLSRVADGGTVASLL